MTEQERDAVSVVASAASLCYIETLARLFAA